MNCPEKRKTEAPTGNIYDKYCTKNPFYKFVTNRFLNTLSRLIKLLDGVESVLETGCGEGTILNYVSQLRLYCRLEGMDSSGSVIEKAKNLHPSLKFSVGSVYKLDYKTSEFDLVLACEVLEHLTDYHKALAEIKRVSNKFCIISVPIEPLWRICNVARGAYLSSLGNTPGHIQHWTAKGFLGLLEKYFSVEKTWYPIPWQVALCKKRR